MIPKCGEIRIWHWAHKADPCDAWSEGETPWHLAWKRQFPESWVERRIERNGVRHVADVLTPRGVVIEVQHSPLSINEVAERESFYGNMGWIFDVREPVEAGRIVIRDKGTHLTFKWNQPRMWVAGAQRPALWDAGDDVYRVRRVYMDERCAGWLERADLDYIKQRLGV
jgi:hypothetical protein